ncbi:DUF7429 family protein [Mycobacteroides salmoniphilum]|uniref:DUF7429 family protein n=1 Tax=Mycobacteroides salmoniphilum TaxID=404941 RepID=UPI001431C14E|nr:hypothetical protein [Mycobacteroides salmoniphilum]
MKLSVKVLGYEVATVELDMYQDNPVSADSIKMAEHTSKVVKWMSRLWVKGMTK